MNPILSFLGGGSGGSLFVQIMAKAVGAAVRGESPETFMKGLAKTQPELRGLDLDNLENTANNLAQKQGKDLSVVKEQVQAEIQKYV